MAIHFVPTQYDLYWTISIQKAVYGRLGQLASLYTLPASINNCTLSSKAYSMQLLNMTDCII